MSNKHIGSSFDDFLADEGILAESEAIAIKRVIAFQLREKMSERHLSKSAMAHEMNTSRSSLNRLLDPENASVTLHTLESAAQALGHRLRISLA
ncbi:MAG: helix-turn-helix transcriptional regulator [Mariprofundaceae bacterium]|nr:helix-turn-helix transcriptional regulator [Mariprofundaceae bacterium]